MRGIDTRCNLGEAPVDRGLVVCVDAGDAGETPSHRAWPLVDRYAEDAIGGVVSRNCVENKHLMPDGDSSSGRVALCKVHQVSRRR